MTWLQYVRYIFGRSLSITLLFGVSQDLQAHTGYVELNRVIRLIVNNNGEKLINSLKYRVMLRLYNSFITFILVSCRLPLQECTRNTRLVNNLPVLTEATGQVKRLVL